MHTAAEWVQIALADTRQEEASEATHPKEKAILLGAGQWSVKMYGKVPDAAFVEGSPEFIAWWKTDGAAGMEQWAKDGFPMLLDPVHMVYAVMALRCAVSTPPANPDLARPRLSSTAWKRSSPICGWATTFGVETRPDQTPANRRPFFIFVYRYATP